MPPVTFPSTTGLKFSWEYPSLAGRAFGITPEPPSIVEYQLLQIQEYLENPVALAEEAKKALQYDMAYKFHTETDPEGDPWMSLLQPAPEQQGILQLTGEMRDRAIDDESWIASGAGVFFDPTYMSFGAPYWAYHEQPDYPAPHRVHRREFVGPTRQAELAISRLGDEWLQRGIMLGSQFKHEARAPSGIFVSLK